VLDIKTASVNNAKESNNASNNSHTTQSLPKPSLEFPAIEPEKNYLGTFSIIALILVVLSAVGIYIMKSNKNSLLTTKTTEANNLIQQLNTAPLSTLNDQIVNLQNGLTVFQSAMQGKVYYSKLFAELQKIVPKSVRLTNLSVDENNATKMGGETTNFSDIGVFIKSLQSSQDFSDVQLISSTTSDASGTAKVTFSVSCKLNASALKQNVSASDNSTTNATSNSTGTAQTASTPAQ
jgi:Tfp pilus assembly protein PilN